MKIAILSMQRVINYGSVLQAYSLKSIIEELSKENVKFIDIDRSEKINLLENKTHCDKSNDNKNMIKRNIFLILRKLHHKYLVNKYRRNIQLFQEKELKLNDIDNTDNYDLVVIGSDEVFIANKYICLQLYGKVRNAKKVVTYAASAGVAEIENIPNNAYEKVSDSLNNIKLMSVRDDHTKQYVEYFYKKDIYKHIDPVLMGNLRCRKHRSVPIKNYIIIYAYAERIWRKEEITAIKTFAKQNNKKIICVGGEQLWCKDFLTVDPFRMLDYFYYADYVITDTFHGTIFSIINHVQFVVLPRESNKFKIKGLLDTFNLGEKRLNSLNDLSFEIKKKINYQQIDKILDYEQIKSKDYLMQCLNIGEQND